MDTIASDTATDVATAASETATDAETSTGGTIRSFANDNALALTLSAFAVGIVAGFVAGMLISRTGIEVRIIPLAGEIRHRAVETGEKVIHRGQQMARAHHMQLR